MAMAVIVIIVAIVAMMITVGVGVGRKYSSEFALARSVGLAATGTPLTTEVAPVKRTLLRPWAQQPSARRRH